MGKVVPSTTTQEFDEKKVALLTWRHLPVSLWRRWRSRFSLSRLAWGLVALNSGGGKARGLMRFWLWVDDYTLRTLGPISEIPDAPYGLIKIRFAPFEGMPMTLPDGTTIRPGDRIGEIHVDGTRTAKVMAEERVWGLVRATRGDLQALAKWMQTDAFDGIQAVMGVTMLYPIAERLGFTARPRPAHKYSRIERSILKGWIILYNPDGVKRLDHGSVIDDYPRETWFSRSALAQRYGTLQTEP